MTTAAPSAVAILKSDTQALHAFWQAMVRPGEVHEVRIPGTRKGPQRLFGTVAGYFDDADAAVAALERVTGHDAAGVYVTMNPVKPALLARACNRLVDKVKTTASDGDIVRRRHLLIDLDPVRDPADVSASGDEVALAVARRDAIRQYLAEEHGWPEPVVISQSGNGGALHYRIDLPNDDAATQLVQRVLQGLDALFSDETVKLDVVNYNAARLTKAIGTVAAKGDNFVGHPPLPDRPWRLATATYPAQAEVVTAEQLAAVAAGAASSSSEPERNAEYQHKADGVPGQRTWSMKELLRLNGLDAAARPWCGGTKYPLDHCLTSPDHADGAALLEMPSGAIVYRCHHNRCADKDWAYVRAHNIVLLPDAGRCNGRRDGHAEANGQGKAGASDGQSAHEQPAGGDWEEPIPLTAGELPAFSVDALPSWLAQQVRAVARFTQTPADLAAMIGLSATAVPCAKKVRIEVKPGYTEPANIYTATAMIPGSRKTAVFAAMVAPLEEWEEEQARQMEGEIAEARTTYDIRDAALKKAKTEAANAKPAEREQKTKDAMDLARQLADLCVPEAPRVIADDCSPEKVASLLHAQGGRLALMSPEGDVFDLMAGRYGNGPNLGVYLKGHAGDTVRVDRIGRPAEYVRLPALTMGLAVQPDVLAGLMALKGFRGRGLLGRFVYSLPPNLLGTRDTMATPIPDGTTAAYRRGLHALLNLTTAKDHNDQPTTWIVKLSPAARDRLAAFEKEIEPHLAREGALGSMTDWGGKLVGAVARITLLLHMAEHAHEAAPWDVRIALRTVEGAIKIGHYATAHAQAAYAVMGGDAAVEGASHVLGWIENKNVSTFKQREAHRALQGRFERAETLKAALVVLEERGYIKEQEQKQEPRKGVGRPASPRYDVNPWVREHPRQSNSVKASILSEGVPGENGPAGDGEAVEEIRV